MDIFFTVESNLLIQISPFSEKKIGLFYQIKLFEKSQ